MYIDSAAKWEIALRMDGMEDGSIARVARIGAPGGLGGSRAVMIAARLFGFTAHRERIHGRV
jgi:hypothetical protein